MKNNSSAQGTIEYLVIIAIVVVISLVVVGLLITLFDSPSQEINSSSSKTGEVAIGGISIVESVIDPSGDSLIKLSNNSSDAITLTKISAGSVDNNFLEQLVGLDSKVFSLSGLASSCPCVSGQASVKCELKIEYTTVTGIEKTEYRTINVMCVSDANGTGGVVEPLDKVPPVVLLSTPLANVNTSNKTVSFTFNVTDRKEIEVCELNVGNDVNSYTGIIEGQNTIVYRYANDFLSDWNISCTDKSNNIGYSETRKLDVDSTAYQITTCLELQEMNNNLDGDYILMNDINCSVSRNFPADWWGHGFNPVGTCANSCFYASVYDYGYEEDTPFTGSLDGNYYSINNLYSYSSPYNYWAENLGAGPLGFGLFSLLSGATIKNLNLIDVNINANPFGGGLCGMAKGNTTISNVFVSGNIVSSNYFDSAGTLSLSPIIYGSGICAYIQDTNISGAHSSAEVKTISLTDEGSSIYGGSGISAYVENSHILNSYNSGEVADLVATLEYGSTITNSYNSNTGRLASLVIWGIIKNSFNVGTGDISNFIYQFEPGSLANDWWYNSETNCCFSGTCTNCTKAVSAAAFYNSNHAVYVGNPLWNDGNWVWSETTYPTLVWE